MIDIFFMFLKKAMLAIVFVIFGFATVYIPHPPNNVQEAHAGGVVYDPSNWIQNNTTAISTAGNLLNTAWLIFKEEVLDNIAWAIAKQFVSNMVASIVDWINNGFEGSPAFVQDVENFLLQAADEVVGRRISALGEDGSSFVCSPFRFNVQLAVAIQWDLTRENAVPECTLTDIIDNFDDFMDGDFAAGGWDGWFSLVGQPNSTPYGSILAAQSQTNIEVNNAKGEQVTLLGFGNGFLSFELCPGAEGGGGTEEECFITKPGRMIADQLNKSLGAGQDALIEADELNEIVIALIGQLSSTVITGVNGTLGLSGGNGVGYTRYDRTLSFTDAVQNEYDLSEGVISGGGFGNEEINEGVSSGDPAGSYIANSVSSLVESADAVQNYIDRLEGFIANTNNADYDVVSARFALIEAESLLTRIVNSLVPATDILEDYNTLEAEYATADIASRAEIRSRQSALLQDFNDLNLVSTQEVSAYSSSWEALLARDDVPSFIPTFTPDFDLGPIGL